MYWQHTIVLGYCQFFYFIAQWNDNDDADNYDDNYEEKVHKLSFNVEDHVFVHKFVLISELYRVRAVRCI